MIHGIQITPCSPCSNWATTFHCWFVLIISTPPRRKLLTIKYTNRNQNCSISSGRIWAALAWPDVHYLLWNMKKPSYCHYFYSTAASTIAHVTLPGTSARFVWNKFVLPGQLAVRATLRTVVNSEQFWSHLVCTCLLSWPDVYHLVCTVTSLCKATLNDGKATGNQSIHCDGKATGNQSLHFDCNGISV